MLVLRIFSRNGHAATGRLRRCDVSDYRWEMLEALDDLVDVVEDRFGTVNDAELKAIVERAKHALDVAKRERGIELERFI